MNGNIKLSTVYTSSNDKRPVHVGILVVCRLWEIADTLNTQPVFTNITDKVDEAAQVNFKWPSFSLEGLDGKKGAKAFACEAIGFEF